MSRSVPAGGGRGVGADPVTELLAPAKLTLGLEVTGVRSDGYHLLAGEFVTVDLCDRLLLGKGDGLRVSYEPCEGDLVAHGEASVDGRGEGEGGDGGDDRWPWPRAAAGAENLVARALGTVGRTASVHLVKRIPPGAGLGGGSADAGAILRWAGCSDPSLAATLGADVPFCMIGGRARVSGIGEVLEPLPYENRTFTLLLAPFGMDTAAVYAAWDELDEGRLRSSEDRSNALEPAAVAVEPRLLDWKRALAAASGKYPHLAGSGSTWFVEGSVPATRRREGCWLRVGTERALLVEVKTVPSPD